MLIKKIINKIRQKYAIPPERLFQLSPVLPLPSDVSEKELFEFVTSVRVTDAPEKEMQAYGSHDFKRFVYTLGLVDGLEGKCLELGANPYFTTMLLEHFTKLKLTLANYFGSIPNGIHSQDVAYNDLISGVKSIKTYHYEHFNIEGDLFPYKDSEFDVVVLAEIIEHLLNDPCSVIREIKRVLKPGGTLILTTPNVARLENIARLISGENIYDPYSGYGPYGRHNREYNRHDLAKLLEHEGFDLEVHFTADVHANNANVYCNLNQLAPMIKFREQDLGQYIFIKAKVSKRDVPKTRPSWLYRSYPKGELN